MGGRSIRDLFGHALLAAVVVLLLIPQFPVHVPQARHGTEFQNAALIDTMADRPLGRAASAASASNFSWNPSVAAPLPVSAEDSNGMGLTAMVSKGTTAVLFGSQRSGPGFVSYTRLYEETNNTWWNLSGPMPPPLSNFSMTADPVFEGGSAILFGGENAATPTQSNTTWAFSFALSSWQRLTTTGTPPARSDAALASDPANGLVVMIGGWNDSAGVLSDLWELNLSVVPYAWKDMEAGPNVGGYTTEFGASLTAIGNHNLLLFGGCTDTPSTSCSNETVGIHLGAGLPSYQVHTTAGPVMRAFANWVWDPVQEVMILYGGENLQTNTLTFGDAWEYVPQHNLWISQSASPAPNPRYLASAAWLNASSNETMVLTGGVVGLPDAATDVWRFAPTINLTVFVNDTQHNPLGNVRVTAFVGYSSWSGLTDSNGKALLAEIAYGPTSVIATLKNYYDSRGSLVTVAGVNAQLALVMTPEPVLAIRTWSNITGVISPLAGTNLSLNASVPAGLSDSHGWLNLTEPHGGPVTYNGTHAGFAPAGNSTVIAYTGRTFLNVTLKPNPPASLDVHVNSTDGMTLAGASVNVTNLTGENLTTNAKGYANFTNLQPVDILVVVKVWMHDFYRNSTWLYLPAGRIVHANVTLTAFPILKIRTWEGTKGKSPTPLSGVSLFWNTSTSGPSVGTSDTGGWWNDTVPHGGPVFFNGSKVGFADAGNHTTLPRTGTAYLNLTLNASFVKLVVHVTNLTGGILFLARVSVTDSQGSVINTTDAAGYANFSNVAPGSVQARTSAQGYYANLTTLQVPPALTTFLNVTLTPWPSLHVHVMGQPLNGAPNVALWDASVFRNLTQLGTTDVLGWLNITATNPGSANVSASYPEYNTSYRMVTLNHTGVLNVLLVLEPITGTLHVQVLTQSASSGARSSSLLPLASAQVNVTDLDTSQLTFANTGISGWANLTVMRGNYSVTGWDLYYLPVKAQGPIFLGTHSITFILSRIPGANVSVLVHDRNTTLPISGAFVHMMRLTYLSTNTTGSDGVAYLPNVWPPGNWFVQVTASGYLPNSTTLTVGLRETLPQILVNLTPMPSHHETTNSTTSPFSLVPPAEQTLWWPFLILPLIFVVGAVILIAAQRSSRRSAT